MAMVTLVAGQRVKASELNSNFANSVACDTARTVAVTHTYTASQTFTGGWTAGAACTISTGGLTVTAGGLTVTAGGLTVTAGGLTVSASGITVTGNSTITGTLGGITTGTFTVRLTSATNAAGSSFAATGGEWYAHTTNGASVGGYGTSYDVAFLNRSGTVAMGVVANSTNVTVVGTVNSQTISSSASFTGTLDTAGKIQATVTTEQMRLRYDATHFFTATVGSGHQVTFNTSGSATVAFQLNSNQKFSILDTQTYASVPMEIEGAAIDGTGTGITYGGTTQTTVGAAGAASALPAQPTGYILIYVGSNQRAVPFYAAS